MLLNGSCGQWILCIKRNSLFCFGTTRCVKHNVACQHSQQTRDVDPMLVQCWPTVCDSGPASNQHWFKALCLLIAAGLVMLTAAAITSWHRPMSAKCWVSVAVAGQYPFSPGQYFMLAGALAHPAWRTAADSEMVVFAYFTSVHITVSWKVCDGHCCRQKNVSICLFHKCAYTVFWKGCDRQKRAQWHQRKRSIYLIYNWAHTAFCFNVGPP